LNIVDLIVVVVVVLGGWNGYRSGLFRQITKLFGAVIAYFIAMWLRPYVAPVIRNMHIFSQIQTGMFGYLLGDVSGAVAFAVLFFVTFFLMRYAAGLVDALFSLPFLSTINRLAGLAAGLVLAIVFVYIIGLVCRYINNPSLQVMLSHSVILRWLDGYHATIMQN